ncbi:MAG: hypothetical protein WC455_13085 [Dehalococcoidia bacterium]|jgi:hypothetical protein
MVEGFLKDLILARATRVAADFVAYYLSAFDAAALEVKIAGGWSLVDTVRQRPREELLEVLDTVLDNYQDVKSIIEKSRKQGAQATKSDGTQFLKEIKPIRLIHHISKKLPAQGAVLQSYPEWVQDEILKVADIIV